MQNDASVKHHAVSMTDCTQLSVSGVTEVNSFDEFTVELVTICGNMTIEGDGLHISRLDPEKNETDISGHINGIFYSKTKEKRTGFFRRGK